MEPIILFLISASITLVVLMLKVDDRNHQRRVAVGEIMLSNI